MDAQAQGGGDICETCDGVGHVVTYADPYDRGDVSSPEQSPCPACTAPPSAPVGVETVDAAAWIEVLELPEGFRVAEHLPGIWEYQFDIEDEADEDSDRKVSGASWNHPALAAIAAWGHAYDTLAQQPAAVYAAYPTRSGPPAHGGCERCSRCREGDFARCKNRQYAALATPQLEK